MSINKAQAKALADGFLDRVGGGNADKGFQPRETLPEIYLLAGTFIEFSQENLDRSNSNASGKLSSSLKIINPSAKGVDIQMDFYGQFINKGVRGTKGGSGLYAFKTDMPSKAMVNQISKWIKRSRKSSVNVNAQKSISRNEVKNKTVADFNRAYAVARAVKQKGIRATGFIDKASVQLQNILPERLQASFKIDVLNSLPPKLN